MAQQPTCTVLCESKCILGESPTWHEHTLYFIDIKQGVIHCYVPEDGTHRILQPKVGEIGAICPIAGDTEHMLACGTHNIVKVNVSTGEVVGPPVADVPHPHPAMRFNDGKASPQGMLVTGFMHADWRKGHCGHLYALLGGALVDVLNGVQVVLPNGMAWDVAKQIMYFVDSGAGTIRAYSCDDQGVPVRDADGVAQDSRVVVQIPKDVGVPDGMTIDSEGRLWVALGEAGAVACYDPTTGQQVHHIRLVCKRPTACTFGGKDLGTLFVTTREEIGADASPHHGALLAVHVPGVRGAAAAYEART